MFSSFETLILSNISLHSTLRGYKFQGDKKKTPKKPPFYFCFIFLKKEN